MGYRSWLGLVDDFRNVILTDPLVLARKAVLIECLT